MAEQKVSICVDQDLWWVVRHAKGYAFWDGGSPRGELFIMPDRCAASRFSSARLAWFFARSIDRLHQRGALGQPFVTRVTRNRTRASLLPSVGEVKP